MCFGTTLNSQTGKRNQHTINDVIICTLKRVNNLALLRSLTNLCSVARLAAQAWWHITISAKATKCKKGRKRQRAVTRPAVNQSLFPVWATKEGRKKHEGKKGIDELRWSDGREIELKERKELKTLCFSAAGLRVFSTHAQLSKQRVNKHAWVRKKRKLYS